MLEHVTSQCNNKPILLKGFHRAYHPSGSMCEIVVRPSAVTISTRLQIAYEMNHSTRHIYTLQPRHRVRAEGAGLPLNRGFVVIGGVV